MKQVDIFVAFFRSGMLGYGGGPSTIPLVHNEVVKRYQWLNDEEFGDVLAIGNTLPGPIITKMAGYIGYRVGGVLGLMNALLATILPTVILLIVLLMTLTSFKDLRWVQGMTKAIIPVVGVMLAVLTWQFIQSALSGLGWLYTALHVAVGVVLIGFLGLHPVFMIGVLLVFALLKPTKKTPKSDEGAS